MTLFGTVFDAS